MCRSDFLNVIDAVRVVANKKAIKVGFGPLQKSEDLIRSRRCLIEIAVPRLPKQQGANGVATVGVKVAEVLQGPAPQVDRPRRNGCDSGIACTADVGESSEPFEFPRKPGLCVLVDCLEGEDPCQELTHAELLAKLRYIGERSCGSVKVIVRRFEVSRHRQQMSRRK